MKTYEQIISNPKVIEKINGIQNGRMSEDNKQAKIISIHNKARELAELSAVYEIVVNLMSKYVGSRDNWALNYVESLLDRHDVYLQKSIGSYIPEEN